MIIHTSVGDLPDGSVIESNKTMLASGMTRVLLGPFFGISVKEIPISQPFHHLKFIKFMFQLKLPSTWSPYWVSISTYCNFSQVHFDAPILIISFLASSMQSSGCQKFSSKQEHSFSDLETCFGSMPNLLVCYHVHGNQL